MSTWIRILTDMLLPAFGAAMATLILFDYLGSDPVDKGGLAVCAVLFFITLAVRLGWALFDAGRGRA